MNIEARLREALSSVTKASPPPALLERTLSQLPARHKPSLWGKSVRGTAVGLVVVVVAALLAVSLPSPRTDGDRGGAATGGSPVVLEGRGGEMEAGGSISSPTASPMSSKPSATPVEELPSSTYAPSATPLDGLTEKQRSDFFWGKVTNFAVYGHTYDSLDEITRAAHVVVRGRVTDLRLGEVQPFGRDLPDEMAQPYPEIFGSVSIDEVLKGDPIMRTPGFIEVAGLGRSSMSVADLPEGEFIIFLMNHARQREERGLAASDDPDDRFHYERPNGYQCVLRNSNGSVDIIDGPEGWEEALGPFPSGLDGVAFDAIVKQIRVFARDTT
jgi:hypothetical protein